MGKCFARFDNLEISARASRYRILVMTKFYFFWFVEYMYEYLSSTYLCLWRERLDFFYFYLLVVQPKIVCLRKCNDIRKMHNHSEKYLLICKICTYIGSVELNTTHYMGWKVFERTGRSRHKQKKKYYLLYIIRNNRLIYRHNKQFVRQRKYRRKTMQLWFKNRRNRSVPSSNTTIV